MQGHFRRSADRSCHFNHKLTQVSCKPTCSGEDRPLIFSSSSSHFHRNHHNKTHCCRVVAATLALRLCSFALVVPEHPTKTAFLHSIASVLSTKQHHGISTLISFRETVRLQNPCPARRSCLFLQLLLVASRPEVDFERLSQTSTTSQAPAPNHRQTFFSEVEFAKTPYTLLELKGFEA